MKNTLELYLVGRTAEAAILDSYAFQDEVGAMQSAEKSRKGVFKITVTLDSEQLTELPMTDRLKDEAQRILTESEYLATILHAFSCRLNHTDGCSWLYETWGEPGYAKRKYLEKADKVVQSGVNGMVHADTLELSMDTPVDWAAEKKFSWKWS